jgi:DASS family divalent anion:Na+ symporter
VLTWRDCLEYSPAWDTLIWFAILISMSNGLSESGLITTFAGMVGDQLNALNLGWQVSLPRDWGLGLGVKGLHFGWLSVGEVLPVGDQLNALNLGCK